MLLASVLSQHAPCFLAVPIVSAGAPETCRVHPSRHQRDAVICGAFYTSLNLWCSNFWLRDWWGPSRLTSAPHGEGPHHYRWQGQHLHLLSLPPVTYLSAMASDNCSAGIREGRENAKGALRPHFGSPVLWGRAERAWRGLPGRCWLRGRQPCPCIWASVVSPLWGEDSPSLCWWSLRSRNLCAYSLSPHRECRTSP